MCSMFAQYTASKRPSDGGHGDAQTSSSDGGRTLASAAVHAAIAAERSASPIRRLPVPPRRAGETAACWPLPLAISSRRGPGSTAVEHLEDRCLLRSAAGLNVTLFFLTATP